MSQTYSQMLRWAGIRPPAPPEGPLISLAEFRARSTIPMESRSHQLSGMPDWLHSPVGFMRRRYQAYGSVFAVRFLRNWRVVLVGPEASELVLLNRGRAFSNRLGWEPEIGTFFHGGLMLRDADEHLRHRRIMQVAFRKDALVSYVDRMTPMVSRLADGWVRGRAPGAREPVSVYPTVKQLTLDVASELFLGETLGERADAINRAFVDTVAASGPGTFVRLPIPGTPYHRGLEGRRYLEAYFREQLPRKRRERSTDFFSELCHAQTPDGESLSDDDIVDHMIFLMMAAHDTTNITLNTVLYQLARHPEWQQRCRDQACALGARTFAYGDLPALSDLDLVMKESLRVLAPLPVMARRTVRDVEFAGHCIPAGTSISITPAFVHHMDEHWPDHRVFDPERFTPERSEGRHRFAWFPYGGGAHMCLGAQFAVLQVHAVLTDLLRRYRWSVPARYRWSIDNRSLPKMRDGLPMTFTRL